MRAITRKKGFTLIEVVVTVAIVGILAAAAFPFAQMVHQRQKEAELRLHLRQIRQALDAYHRAWEADHIERRVGDSGYPPRLETLVDGVTDARDPNGRKIYFLRRIPRDPFETDARITDAETWRRRSYASSADNPQEGIDVYDVYTRKTGKGLNGIPYRDW